MVTKSIIVDDEPLALELIGSYIEKIPGIEVAARCANALEAFEVLRTQKIDLIFLDIQMPELNGIQFIKTLRHPPKVILTTAHREYALDGYDLDVVDYLLKPVSFERFLQAIDKYYRTLQDSPVLVECGDAGQAEEYLFIRADRKVQKVVLKDVLYLESLKDYVRIFTATKTILARMTLAELENCLPECQFVRIHRSYIISLARVDAFTSTTVEIGRRELPIGRMYKNSVLEALKFAGGLR